MLFLFAPIPCPPRPRPPFSFFLAPFFAINQIASSSFLHWSPHFTPSHYFSVHLRLPTPPFPFSMTPHNTACTLSFITCVNKKQDFKRTTIPNKSFPNTSLHLTIFYDTPRTSYHPPLHFAYSTSLHSSLFFTQICTLPFTTLVTLVELSRYPPLYSTHFVTFLGRGGHQMIPITDLGGIPYLWVFGGRGGDNAGLNPNVTYYNDMW